MHSIAKHNRRAGAVILRLHYIFLIHPARLIIIDHSHFPICQRQKLAAVQEKGLHLPPRKGVRKGDWLLIVIFNALFFPTYLYGMRKRARSVVDGLAYFLFHYELTGQPTPWMNYLHIVVYFFIIAFWMRCILHLLRGHITNRCFYVIMKNCVDEACVKR